MPSELSQIFNQGLLYPFIFIISCILTFEVVGVFVYYKWLNRWLPEFIAKLVGFAGAAYILVTCINHYESIKSLVSHWTGTGIIIGYVLFFIVLALLVTLLGSTKKSRKAPKIKQNTNPKPRTIQHNRLRPDNEILSSPLEAMSGAEFERLLALYFRDQNYSVHEVGVGGNDGGVDLVIIDQRGEKTAVQAKCYANHNQVGVQIVRELVGAKRNHDCILSLLITTSDLTGPAKKEAEQFKVDYWHGGVLTQKLKIWGKWNPEGKKGASPPSEIPPRAELQEARAQVATASEMMCTCGAPMVQRKGREGKPFWGCSTFPKCRHTKSI